MPCLPEEQACPVPCLLCVGVRVEGSCEYPKELFWAAVPSGCPRPRTQIVRGQAEMALP